MTAYQTNNDDPRPGNVEVTACKYLKSDAHAAYRLGDSAGSQLLVA